MNDYLFATFLLLAVPYAVYVVLPRRVRRNLGRIFRGAL